MVFEKFWRYLHVLGTLMHFDWLNAPIITTHGIPETQTIKTQVDHLWAPVSSCKHTNVQSCWTIADPLDFACNGAVQITWWQARFLNTRGPHMMEPCPLHLTFLSRWCLHVERRWYLIVGRYDGLFTWNSDPAVVAILPSFVILQTVVSPETLFTHHFLDMCQTQQVWTGCPWDSAPGLRGEVAFIDCFSSFVTEVHLMSVNGIQSHLALSQTCARRPTQVPFLRSFMEKLRSIWQKLERSQCHSMGFLTATGSQGVWLSGCEQEHQEHLRLVSTKRVLIAPDCCTTRDFAHFLSPCGIFGIRRTWLNHEVLGMNDLNWFNAFVRRKRHRHHHVPLSLPLGCPTERCWWESQLWNLASEE